MRTRTKAKPAALLLLALFAALLLAVHGMPSVGSGSSGATATRTGSPGSATPTGTPGVEGRTASAVGTGFGLGTASSGGTLPFTVTGGVTGLAPGLWRPVAATVHNPNAIPIRVTSLELAVTSDSFPPGCRAATNLEIRQGSLGAEGAIVVPARGSVALVDHGGADPRIRLRDLPTVNQDVCKGKSFTLVWSGTATS